jgi:hypothetical protein
LPRGVDEFVERPRFVKTGARHVELAGFGLQQRQLLECAANQQLRSRSAMECQCALQHVDRAPRIAQFGIEPADVRQGAGDIAIATLLLGGETRLQVTQR